MGQPRGRVDHQPGRDGRLLALVHRPARDPVPAAQGAGWRDHRDRGSGFHPLPVRQLAGRPVLAADPPVPRLLVARGGLAQVHRSRVGRRGRRHGAGRLLGAGCGDPRRRPTADLLRLVPRLHPDAPRQWRRELDDLRDHLRRVGRGDRPDHRPADGLRGLLRRLHEHVLPARWLVLDQPGPVHPRHRPDAGLEGRRLLRRRPLPAADARDAVAAGHDRRSRHAAAGRRRRPADHAGGEPAEQPRPRVVPTTRGRSIPVRSSPHRDDRRRIGRRGGRHRPA